MTTAIRASSFHSGATQPPQRRPLIPGDLRLFDEPVTSELRRPETSSPDLCSQRVGGDAESRGRVAKGQESQLDASPRAFVTATLAGTLCPLQRRSVSLLGGLEAVLGAIGCSVPDRRIRVGAARGPPRTASPRPARDRSVARCSAPIALADPPGCFYMSVKRPQPTAPGA